MRLQGNIDAAVNGGVAKYRKAFFTSEYCAGNPGEYHMVESLASLIEEQSRLLGEVLDLHGQLCQLRAEPLQPLHDRLVELYTDMKDWMMKTVLMSSVGRVRVPSIVNTPLPPLPGGNISASYARICDTEDNDNLDNCYHEVIIGDPVPDPLPPPPQVLSTKIAPPLPPRGVKTVLTMSPLSPTSPLHESYTHIPPALPSRLSTFQGSEESPPPLMRKLSGSCQARLLLISAQISPFKVSIQ